MWSCIQVFDIEQIAAAGFARSPPAARAFQCVLSAGPRPARTAQVAGRYPAPPRRRALHAEDFTGKTPAEGAGEADRAQTPGAMRSDHKRSDACRGKAHRQPGLAACGPGKRHYPPGRRNKDAPPADKEIRHRCPGCAWPRNQSESAGCCPRRNCGVLIA